jgi:methionyl-tRNA synthetase
MAKFFVSTPIYYINDIPHIGHTCTTVAADLVARMHRIMGDEVFFLTGTDEHGQKVAETAKKAGLETKAYCDKIAPRFDKAWKSLNISHDFFIRTTDPRHEEVVKEFLEKIYKKGDIYKAKYEGKYCVGCEKFLTESDMENGICPLHPPEKTIERSEENWFFKLSSYTPKLIELIENDETNYIMPEGKRNEVLAKLKAGVNDISFTRENVDWGIAAAWDESQTIYVWVDALINYYSATRFLKDKEDFWPADIHLLGKEILWFHAVIWQAMLMSAGISLPKKIFVHSFYMIDGQKMSKSVGNVILPEQLVEKFGVDGARYLVASSFPRDNDADVGMNRFVQKYNADLANNLGNLVSRVSKMGEGIELPKDKIELDKKFTEAIDRLSLEEAIGFVFDSWINPANLKLNEKEPWKMEKESEERKALLRETGIDLKKAAYHLKIVMPEVSKKIENVFGDKITALEKPLFPRIND